MLEVLIGINGREIGRLRIVNDTTGTDEAANYIVHNDGGSFALCGHNRSQGAWVLADMAIRQYVHVPGADDVTAVLEAKDREIVKQRAAIVTLQLERGTWECRATRTMEGWGRALDTADRILDKREASLDAFRNWMVIGRLRADAITASSRPVDNEDG